MRIGDGRCGTRETGTRGDGVETGTGLHGARDTGESGDMAARVASGEDTRDTRGRESRYESHRVSVSVRETS